MRGRWVAPERARRWGGGGWGVRVVVGKTRMAVGDGRNAGMAVGASTDWRGRRASTDQSLEGYVTRAEERSRPRCRGASTGGGESAPRRVTHGLDADGNRISGGGETRCRKRQPLDQSDGTSATGIWYSMRQFRNDAPPTVRLFLYPPPAAPRTRPPVVPGAGLAHTRDGVGPPSAALPVAHGRGQRSARRDRAGDHARYSRENT